MTRMAERMKLSWVRAYWAMVHWGGGVGLVVMDGIWGGGLIGWDGRTWRVRQEQGNTRGETGQVAMEWAKQGGDGQVGEWQCCGGDGTTSEAGLVFQQQCCYWCFDCSYLLVIGWRSGCSHRRRSGEKWMGVEQGQRGDQWWTGVW